MLLFYKRIKIIIVIIVAVELWTSVFMWEPVRNYLYIIEENGEKFKQISLLFAKTKIFSAVERLWNAVLKNCRQTGNYV